ncbi:MAG: hypothetical protein WEB33_05705 [Bacteroidota bacterium]
MILARRLCIILCTLLIPLAAKSQRPESDTILLTPPDSLYHLSNEFLIQESETVLFDGSRELHRGADYELNWRFGTLRVLPPLLDSLGNDRSQHFLQITYLTIPISFRREYFLKEIEVLKDSTVRMPRRIQPPARPFSMDDMFGSMIQKSGSLTRGFSIGSNRDLSLNSGFRMQMAGRLSREIDMVAVLTDESTPIQPEGTTQTLQEVDKVFIEINHPSGSATLGDFNETIERSEGGEFGRVSRKLQGARGTLRSNLWDAENSASVSLLGGTARGKFLTKEFRGQEGNQGPYRLTGAGGERNIIVIAGSERVYLDGIQMTRGEVNDYTAEYASGELTFTNRRLITSASRIVVDFEYSERFYDRNMFGASVTGSFAGNNLRINTLFLQESDDPESPIDGDMDEATRAILASSGSDPLKASTSGFQFVGRDSITNIPRGQYIAKDTVINGFLFRIAIYAPGDSLALYSVAFSPVDRMPADSAGYVRVGLGHFRFAGIGMGNYLPIRTIPLPSLHRFIGVNAEALLFNGFSVSGEFAASRFDRNRLSGVDDRTNDDQAGKFLIQFRPRNVRVGGMNLGNIDLSYSERFVGARFVSPDRVNDVEFARKWNFDTIPGGDERTREVGLLVSPDESIRFGFGYGLLDKPGLFRSQRLDGHAQAGDSLQNDTRWRIEHIKSEESAMRSSWLRHGGGVAYKVGPLRPAIRMETEQREIKSGSRDSLNSGSFQFVEWGPSVTTEEILQMRGSAEVQIRKEDSAFAGSFQPASVSFTQSYTWQLRDWNSLNSSVSLSARKTRFEEQFRQRGNINSDVIMIRTLTRFTPRHRGVEGDVFYEFSNRRSARLERVYVRVPQGEGNYQYRGDVNGNGVADDDEFELTRFDGDYIVLLLPGEALHPVADVKASLRIRLAPSRILSNDSFVGSLLTPLSTETFIRVDERSADPRTENIYFLKFSSFLHPENTIAGSQLFTQDIHAFENKVDFSARFRFSQRKALVQFISALERNYARERSVRIRTQLMPEITNQTDFANKTDRVAGSVPGPRDRDLVIHSVNSDFAYRPFREWEVGLRILFEQTTDDARNERTAADVNEQALRVVYAIPGKGQIRGEVTREEVVLSQMSADPQRLYPYEFTQGRAFGKNYLWTMNVDYRLTQHIQFTLHYSGRSESGRNPVHLARAEARAFF